MMKQKARRPKQLRTDSAVCKPTLDEEIKSIKPIVRHIMRHETAVDQSKSFHAGSKNRLRRFAKLGLLAHQPAIAAYCKVIEEERGVIIESLLQQKVGSKPKSMKVYHDNTESNPRGGRGGRGREGPRGDCS